METTITKDLSRYRPNAGIVLINDQGLTWLGKRKGEAGPYVWQWPQGGMDKGEDLRTAGLRELYEETGIREDKVSYLGETQDWITYDFPPEVLAKRPDRPWIGQKQKWLALRFLGDDRDFDLKAVPPQEFEAFAWEGVETALARIIPWKRPVYEAVAAAFKPYTA